MRSFHRGIAIGPILLVLGLLAVIIGAMNMGSGDFSGALNADRITADLRGQVDMIRAKIGECVFLTRQADAPQYMYPGDNSLDTVYTVRELPCPRESGSNNLWQGRRPANLPAPPAGFDEWMYVNHGDPTTVTPGGTCIYIQPTAAQATSPRVREGISKILRYYTTSEYTYDPNSANQRLIIWLRKPASGTTC